MVQSFPARSPKNSFAVCRPVVARRFISDVDQFRAIRQTGEIRGPYQKKGG